MPSPRLNHTYIMWLKTVTGVTPLWSPLMSVKPIDVGKCYIGCECLLMGSGSRMSLDEKEDTEEEGTSWCCLGLLTEQGKRLFLVLLCN